MDQDALAIEISLSPGNFVLDEDGDPPTPIFGHVLLRPNGWMDKDGT